jgi:hypothetical protein
MTEQRRDPVHEDRQRDEERDGHGIGRPSPDRPRAGDQERLRGGCE